MTNDCDRRQGPLTLVKQTGLSLGLWGPRECETICCYSRADPLGGHFGNLYSLQMLSALSCDADGLRCFGKRVWCLFSFLKLFFFPFVLRCVSARCPLAFGQDLGVRTDFPQLPQLAGGARSPGQKGNSQQREGILYDYKGKRAVSHNTTSTQCEGEGWATRVSFKISMRTATSSIS